MRKLFLAGAMLAAAALGAPGLAVVTLGTPLTTGGEIGVESDVNGAAVLAQDLRPTPAQSGTYTINTLTWWGNSFNGPGIPDAFHISFYDAATVGGSAPSSTVKADAVTSAALSFDPIVPLQVTVVPATDANSDPLFDDTGIFPIYKFTWAPGAPVTLAVSGPLFVSIAGEFAGGVDTFLWSSLNLSGSYYQRDVNPPGPWILATPPAGAFGPLAVTLALDPVTPAGPSNVPEPASWALMVVGFGTIGAGLRRRRVAVAAA